jgi:hypothetical protein
MAYRDVRAVEKSLQVKQKIGLNCCEDALEVARNFCDQNVELEKVGDQK